MAPVEDPHRVGAVIVDKLLLPLRAIVDGTDHPRACGSPPQRLLVPARAVAELGRLLTDAEAVRLTPTSDNRALSFAVGGTTLFARLIEGRFPDIERVIPHEWKTRVNVERATFRQAVRVAGLFGGTSESRPVVLEAGPGQLHLRARGDETGDAEADLPADIDGELPAVAVNTRLIADVLEAIDAPQIALSWSSPQTPVVVCEAAARLIAHPQAHCGITETTVWPDRQDYGFTASGGRIEPLGRAKAFAHPSVVWRSIVMEDQHDKSSDSPKVGGFAPERPEETLASASRPTVNGPGSDGQESPAVAAASPGWTPGQARRAL